MSTNYRVRNIPIDKISCRTARQIFLNGHTYFRMDVLKWYDGTITELLSASQRQMLRRLVVRQLKEYDYSYGGSTSE